MESTEKCDAVISHFNGKFLKTPAGVMGNTEQSLIPSLILSPTLLLSVCVCVCFWLHATAELGPQKKQLFT